MCKENRKEICDEFVRCFRKSEFEDDVDVNVDAEDQTEETTKVVQDNSQVASVHASTSTQRQDITSTHQRQDTAANPG